MSACDACLVRPLLLRRLAGHLDRAVARGAGSRARELLALDNAELAAGLTSSAALADAALSDASSPMARSELAGELESVGARGVCRHAGEWPRSLDDLGAAAPQVLFVRGRGSLDGLSCESAATVIGARRAGGYGREVGLALGAELAACQVTVISGMAFGIDTAAHRGALDAGGQTLAVLGAGPDRPYPRSGRRLYEEIVDRGLVVSELPPSTPTFRWVFPARNRVMAALAGMTVVVEAAERSGSLITAEMALDLGRPVGAVPGPVTSWRSSGANLLLSQGATVVRDAGDVLDVLQGPGAAAEYSAATGPVLEEAESRILDAVGAGAGTPDEVVLVTGVGAPEAAVALAQLEVGGYLRRDAAGRLVESGLRPPVPGGQYDRRE